MWICRLLESLWVSDVGISNSKRLSRCTVCQCWLYFVKAFVFCWPPGLPSKRLGMTAWLTQSQQAIRSDGLACPVSTSDEEWRPGLTSLSQRLGVISSRSTEETANETTYRRQCQGTYFSKAFVVTFVLISLPITVVTSYSKKVKYLVKHQFNGQVDLQNGPRSNVNMSIKRTYLTSYMLAIVIFAICHHSRIFTCRNMHYLNHDSHNLPGQLFLALNIEHHVIYRSH